MTLSRNSAQGVTLFSFLPEFFLCWVWNPISLLLSFERHRRMLIKQMKRRTFSAVPPSFSFHSISILVRPCHRSRDIWRGKKARGMSCFYGNATYDSVSNRLSGGCSENDFASILLQIRGKANAERKPICPSFYRISNVLVRVTNATHFAPNVDISVFKRTFLRFLRGW